MYPTITGERRQLPVESPISHYLEHVLDEVRHIDDGEVSEGLPRIDTGNPTELAAAVCTVTGNVYAVGDADVPFTIQSISKSFVYALALQKIGREKVFETVGTEASGEPFNELSLDQETNRPMNPMINAGAIAINQLINGENSSVEDRVELIRAFLSELAGHELKVNEEVIDSELEGSNRNLAIAHMLASHGVIHDDPRQAVISYQRQCSVEVTVRDLAVMSATLANGGVQPVTGKRVLEQDACRLTLAMMGTAGMYDGSGRWMSTVGIPAKSGVSGGLLGTLPGELGLATLSPRLDPKGNSVRGVEIFERFSEEMGLHLMASDPIGVHAVRAIEEGDSESVIQLQGSMHFASTERALDTVSDHEFTGGRIVLDVSRVTSFRRVSRTMILEGLRHLREDGFEVAIHDPNEVIGDMKFSDGTRPEVVDELE